MKILVLLLAFISFNIYSQDDNVTGILVSDVDAAFEMYNASNKEFEESKSIMAIEYRGVYYVYFSGPTAQKKFGADKKGGYYTPQGKKLELNKTKCKNFGLQESTSSSKICKGEYRLTRENATTGGVFLDNNATKKKADCYAKNKPWNKSTGECNLHASCSSDGVALNSDGNAVATTKTYDKAMEKVTKLNSTIQKNAEVKKLVNKTCLSQSEKDHLAKRIEKYVEQNKSVNFNTVSASLGVTNQKHYVHYKKCKSNYSIPLADKAEFGDKLYCVNEIKTKVQTTPTDNRPVTLDLSISKKGTNFFKDNYYDVTAAMLSEIKQKIENKRKSIGADYIVHEVKGVKASSSALRNTGGEYEFAGGVPNSTAESKLKGLSKARLKALVDAIYNEYKGENSNLKKDTSGKILIDGDSTPYIYKNGNFVKGYINSSKPAQSKYSNMVKSASPSNYQKIISEFYDQWQYAVVTVSFKRAVNEPEFKETCEAYALKIKIKKKVSGGGSSSGGSFGGGGRGGGNRGAGGGQSFVGQKLNTTSCRGAQ